VVDTDDQPIAAANIRIKSGVTMGVNFDISGKTGPSPSKNILDKHVKTNENGEYTFFGITSSTISLQVEAPGYYQTFAYAIKESTTVIPLRKKENPVSMYAWSGFLDLPSGEGIYGYDLVLKDLVMPYGRGKRADFEFRVSTYYINTKLDVVDEGSYKGKIFRRLKLALFLPHFEDGLQPFSILSAVSTPRSKYRLPFVAPLDGYLKSLKSAWNAASVDDPAYLNEWYWTKDYVLTRKGKYSHYFLKVRSDAEDGPYYGVMLSFNGGYRGHNTPYVDFNYFLNPDNSRNIERDWSKNINK
jgi:hypothetical protein